MNANEYQRHELDELLAQPMDELGADGVPAWYGSDSDAWRDFQKQGRGVVSAS